MAAGVAPIERIYSGSAGLAGDAVLSFMRALCAVSQEELHPSEPGELGRQQLEMVMLGSDRIRRFGTIGLLLAA